MSVGKEAGKAFFLLPCLFVLSATLGFSRPAFGQELLEIARSHAIRYPGQPVRIPSAPGHYEPKTLEQLTHEAVAVVQATVSRVRSYVGGRRGDRVLTDYQITAPLVIAGQWPASVQVVPGPGTPLPVLTVFGGEVVLEGITVRAADVNRADIKDGGEYLIFLRPSRGANRAGEIAYEIYYGGIFEISGDQVLGLLNKANDVFADFLKDRPKGRELVARIQKAAQHR